MKFSKQDEILAELIRKSWEDDSFKKELINSPVETIEKITGQKVALTEGVSLIVEDQSNPSAFYINIPPKSKMDDFELADEQLNHVAGGRTLPYFPHTICKYPIFPSPPNKDSIRWDALA